MHNSKPESSPRDGPNGAGESATGVPARPGADHESAIVDPPLVQDPPVVSSSWPSELSEPFSEFSRWLDDTLGSESYGAPRVFDLYTLLAVTLAFALMFAALRLIEPLLQNAMPQVAIALGAFVTLIAIAQLAMWNGKKPRIASVIAGPAVWFVIALGFTFQNPRELLNPATLIGLGCSSILGVLAGYLGGAMVAGVFLLADVFRKRFMKSTPETEPSSDDAVFDSED